jgi:hypothetical protein
LDVCVSDITPSAAEVLIAYQVLDVAVVLNDSTSSPKIKLRQISIGVDVGGISGRGGRVGRDAKAAANPDADL